MSGRGIGRRVRRSMLFRSGIKDKVKDVIYRVKFPPEVFLECVENCESNECISECNRSVTECEADCPCQTNCPDGCTGPGIIFISHNDKNLTVTSGKDVATQFVVLRQPQALQRQPRHSLNLVFSFSIHTSQQINQHFSIQTVK